MNLPPVSTLLGFCEGLLPPVPVLLLFGLGLLLLFTRFPEIGRYLGRGIVEFKKGLSGLENSFDDGLSPKDRPRLELVDENGWSKTGAQNRQILFVSLGFGLGFVLLGEIVGEWDDPLLKILLFLLGCLLGAVVGNTWGKRRE